MNMEIIFRLTFLAILVSAILISGTYRRRAREHGDVIARQDEGKAILALRMLFALPLLLALMLYIVYPDGLAWSSLPLPHWLRWIAVVMGILIVPFILWVFRSIGRNISETVLTKSDHELVTSGPYRWIRHPLYAASLWMLFSLSLIASNWFLLAYSVAGLIIFRSIVIPEEEKQLMAAFGDDYREYRNQTGAIFLKLF
jgi:protein-S-isoprenylcysteine O-methyltransferase Ste14